MDMSNHRANGQSGGQGNNKFRCRVAMACVHCRHRKIRCDGAQPSCYTCTRLQRKCEYERVSEQDNLLSRERKRLSRERKAARLAASASHGPSPAPRSQDDKSALLLPQTTMGAPKSAATTFPLPMTPVNVSAPPTEVAPSMIQAPSDPAMAAKWGAVAHPLAPSTKDLMPWVVPPMFSTDTGALPEMASSAPESLMSLRSTADPSLLELGATPSALSETSTSPQTAWTDGALSPTEPPFSSDAVPGLSSMSAGSLSSEATLIDPLDVPTALDTPLKLFSDQQLPSALSGTPSTTDTLPLNETVSKAVPLGISPLSPQLAPPSFDGLEPSLEQCSLADLDQGPAGLAAGMGLYSSSLPAAGSLNLAHELEPSSLPILSSWT